MKNKSIISGEVKPFLSVLIILLTMFSVVFCEMETREAGYVLLKENKKLDLLKRDYRTKNLNLASINRPSRIRNIAMTKLTLKRVNLGQLVQLNGDKVALIH